MKTILAVLLTTGRILMLFCGITLLSVWIIPIADKPLTLDALDDNFISGVFCLILYVNEKKS